MEVFLDLDIKGKIVIITGGGRGLGAEIANAFSEEGTIVVIADINID